ncbi:GntR family transcriptional regulator [Mesorhizobium sp. A556]
MSRLASIYDRSRTPLYVQVASVMRQRIDTGFWLEGDKISTLEELEREFAVARVTVRQAIELLREEGLLDAQQGRGTFVSGKPKHNRWLNLATDFDSMISSIKENVIKRVHIEEDVPLPELTEGEGKLAEGYAFLRSVQYNNDEPFSVVNLYLDQKIFAKGRDLFSHVAALPNIAEMDDISITHAHQTVTIGVADPETAELLKIGLGEPTADCRLVLVDDNDVAIYIANIHYHKSCFALRIDLLEKTGPRRAIKR